MEEETEIFSISVFLYLRIYSEHGRGDRNIPNTCISVFIQDMEEEPGDWVAHQAEVDTLINKIQVVGTTFVLYLLLLIKMSSLVWNFSYSSKKINKE